MNALFGKKKTTKEVVREQQREISKEKRHLDREIRELELQEKRIITKIKQLSAKGDMGSGEQTRRRAGTATACMHVPNHHHHHHHLLHHHPPIASPHRPSAKVLAKQLVQTRSNKARLYQTQGSMSQAQTQMTHAATNVAMSKAMGKTAKVMGAVNRATPVAQQQKMMMAFEKNKEALEMKNEMMDDVLDGDELSDEADEMLDSVFESIGLDVKGSLPATGGSLPESAKMTAAEEEEVAKLLAGI